MIFKDKHKTYQKLLHLYRSGELSRRQAKKLERHLNCCEGCAREKRQIEKTERLMAKARSTTPLLPNPQQLTEVIMQALQYEKSAELVKKGVKYESRWFDWFYMTRVRFALVSIVLVVLGIFIFQSTMILHRVSSLEQKMALQAARAEREWYPRPKKVMLRALEDAARVPDNWPDDWVVIDRKTLDVLLRVYEKWHRGDERGLYQLEKDFPLFEKLDFADGIKKSELKEILKNKKQILQFIDKI
jgi:ribosomal silencing factor RsfS